MGSLKFDVYKRTVQNSPNCWIHINKNGEILYTNESALKLFTDFDDSNVKGKNLIDFISPEYKKILSKYIFSDEKNDAKIYSEGFVTAKDKVVKGTLTVIPIRGTETKSVIIENDICKNNDNKSKDDSKEDYFANVVHELKNPVNVILSAVQLINMYMKNNVIEDESSQLSKYMDVIDQSGKRLIKNINELINVRKIEEGYLSLDLCNCDIVTLVNNVVTSQIEEALYLGINLSVNSSFHKKIITCDIEKMKSIVINLISNALKFTNEGGKVEICLNEKGNKIVLSVRDTGVGISSEDKDIIFEKYKKCKSSSLNTSGSGVGLYIVKLMVEAHGGKIKLKSKIGKGSEFIVELPCMLNKDKTEVSFVRAKGVKEQTDISQFEIINY